jgi:hypothetical protein
MKERGAAEGRRRPEKVRKGVPVEDRIHDRRLHGELLQGKKVRSIDRSLARLDDEPPFL